MKLSRGPLWPLALEPAVHTSFLLVLPQFRRHGYGHALMEAAVTWAEEKDIAQITVVTDGNRDTNRFFARLGLGTLGNVRHAHTAALRKKLAAERAARRRQPPPRRGARPATLDAPAPGRAPEPASRGACRVTSGRGVGGTR